MGINLIKRQQAVKFCEEQNFSKYTSQLIINSAANLPLFSSVTPKDIAVHLCAFQIDDTHSQDSVYGSRNSQKAR